MLDVSVSGTGSRHFMCGLSGAPSDVKSKLVSAYQSVISSALKVQAMYKI